MEIKNFDFEIKEVSDQGVIKGYASTFGGVPDSYGDIVVKGAFSETIKQGGRNGNVIPILWQHDPKEPIGKTEVLEENSKGLKIEAKLSLGVKRGQEAFTLAKDGVIKGFSIGWDFSRDEKGRIKEGAYTYDEKTGYRYLHKVQLWENSLVTFPANTRATITQVKELLQPGMTEREIEKALKKLGLSENSAKYLIRLFDKKHFSREGKLESFDKELTRVIDEVLLKPKNYDEEFLKLLNILGNNKEA